MTWQYMPAGTYPSHATNCTVYCRFERNDADRVTFEIAGKRSALVKAPDRTLLLVNHIHPWDVRPVNDVWDKVWVGDLYDGAWGESLMPHVMLSAWHGTTVQSGDGSSTGIRNRKWLRNNVKLVGDSGGSQLKSGTIDYIDPKSVSTWMNQVCDIGAPLDVAPHQIDFYYPEIWPALIALQKRHNRLFLERARPDKVLANGQFWGGLKLMNPAHGFTIDQIRKWCDGVADDRFIGWAVGGDFGGNLFQHVRSLIVCLKEFSHSGMYHHHQYGAANRTKTPAMAWLGKLLGDDVLLTGDGTGYTDGVAYHRMQLPHINGHIAAEHFGDKAFREMTAMPVTKSPCSCAACASVGGWWEVYAMPRCTPGPNLLLLHELSVVSDWNRAWAARAKNCDSLDEYIEWIRHAFGFAGKRRVKDRYIDAVIALTRYVQMAWHDDIDAANREFSRYFVEEQYVVPATLMKPKFTTSSVAAKVETFGGSFQLPPLRQSVLPHYMTHAEMASFGLKTDDLKKGIADGGSSAGHGKGNLFAGGGETVRTVRV